MMTRRGHGEGSIYQRGDGRYVASLTIAVGQRKYFYGQTRKEVQTKLRKAQRELEEGLLATGPQQTVQTYLETWLKRCKSRLRPNTYLSYRTCVNCHLLPALGHLKLTSLTASRIEAFYDAECQKVSPNMVRLIYTVFKNALQDARGKYLLPSDLLRSFKKILWQAGPPDMRFHDLRHSAATILLAMKVDARLIQERLGHSDITVTLGIYGHVLNSMQKEAIEAIDQAFQQAGNA